MKVFLDPFNLVLWFIVISFWSTVILIARSKGKSISIRLLLIPPFFILVGMTINLYFPRLGTYMIALIHMLMMPLLKKVSQGKQ